MLYRGCLAAVFADRDKLFGKCDAMEEHQKNQCLPNELCQMVVGQISNKDHSTNPKKINCLASVCGEHLCNLARSDMQASVKLFVFIGIVITAITSWWNLN